MDDKQSFYRRILLQPLFQGISFDDFLTITDRVPIRFSRARRDSLIVACDEQAKSLFFILSGAVRYETRTPDNSICISQIIQAPEVVQPEALFGLTTNFTHSCYALRETGYMEIDKAAFRDFLLDYPTIKMNYLNLLCLKLQYAERMLRRPVPTADIHASFCLFLRHFALRPAGHLIIHGTHEDVARQLAVRRVHFAAYIQHLLPLGLVTRTRGRIEVPHLEQLLAYDGK